MSNNSYPKLFPILHDGKSQKRPLPPKSSILKFVKLFELSTVSKASRFKVLQQKLDNNTVTGAEWDEWFKLSQDKDLLSPHYTHQSPTQSPFYIPPLVLPPPKTAEELDKIPWDEVPMDSTETAASAPAKK